MSTTAWWCDVYDHIGYLLWCNLRERWFQSLIFGNITWYNWMMISAGRWNLSKSGQKVIKDPWVIPIWQEHSNKQGENQNWNPNLARNRVIRFQHPGNLAHFWSLLRIRVDTLQGGQESPFESSSGRRSLNALVYDFFWTPTPYHHLEPFNKIHLEVERENIIIPVLDKIICRETLHWIMAMCSRYAKERYVNKGLRESIPR